MGESERDDSGSVEQEIGKQGTGAGRDISESDVVTGDSNTLRRNDANVVVNVEAPRAYDMPAHKQRDRSRLMPEVEQELRGNILELTRAIIRLEGMVDKNNTLSGMQIDAIREQIRAMNDQAASMTKQLSSLMGMGIITPARPVPRWMPYTMVSLLAVIALVAVVGLMYLFVGGGG